MCIRDRTILDKVADIVRTTLSMNGYTALNPNGVLGEGEKEVDDDKGSDSAEEEGESKEEDGWTRLYRYTVYRSHYIRSVRVYFSTALAFVTVYL